MDWETVLRIFIAAVPVLTALIGASVRPDASRQQLRETAEVVPHLPEGQAKEAVLELIAADAKTLKNNAHLKRDPLGLGVGLVGSIGGGYGIIYLASLDTWWSWLLIVPLGFFSLICFVGIFDAAQRVDRDARKEERQRKREARKK